jgi:hypothetical protein
MPPPSPRDLVAAAAAGRAVNKVVQSVEPTAEQQAAAASEAVRLKMAAAEAFREMVDPVLVVLEELDGMSPQGMAALATLFKEISQSPREFQPLVCVCNDTTRLKKYKLMSYMHGHLFESLTPPALCTIAERNGFMPWNTPRLTLLVAEARGDARHLLHALALDNHRRPEPPPLPSQPLALASCANATSKGFLLCPRTKKIGASCRCLRTFRICRTHTHIHYTRRPVFVGGWRAVFVGEWAHQNSSTTLTATVDALFAQAYVRREMSVEAALAVYRGSAYAVGELVSERYTSRKTVADIDTALESADAMLRAAIIGNVRNVLPSSAAMPLLPLNSTWLPLQRFRPVPPKTRLPTPSVGGPVSLAPHRTPHVPVALLAASPPPCVPSRRSGGLTLSAPIQLPVASSRVPVSASTAPTSSVKGVASTAGVASKDGAAIVPFRPMTAEAFMRYKTIQNKLRDLLASTSSLSRTLDALTSTVLPFCERHNMTEREAFGFQQTFI